MSIPESGIEQLLRQGMEVADLKRKRLAEATKEKKNRFQPINSDNLVHIDGDTWGLRDRPGMSFRVGGGVDTFESDISLYNDPSPAGVNRLKRHRRNFAKLTGRNEFFVSKQDMVDRGKTQAAQTAQRMQDLADGGFLEFQQTGTDIYGRGVVDLIDSRTGNSVVGSGREQNASYDSDFNAKQQLADIISGERGRHEAFTGTRSVKDFFKDQVPGFIGGVGRIGVETGQAAVGLLGLSGEGTDKFFDKSRKGLDWFKNRFTSAEAKGRDRLAEKNAARLEEFYEVNRQEYIKEGYSDTQAHIAAGIDEFGDAIKGLIANPGRIMDATVESLPYMFGVAAAGRRAITKTIEATTKKATAKFAKRGFGEAAEARATVQVNKYFSTDTGKKVLQATAKRSAMTTVGLLEGFSTGAEVYDSIMGMTPEDAQQSIKYRQLINQGMSHEDALRKLATEALRSTVTAVAIMAAAASRLSGAAGFESTLFTGLADIRKKTAGEVIKVGLFRSTLNKVTGQIRAGAGPGGREALEESIQSGGGEFLSQLNKFDVTGEPVGPGVGSATGEGAIIGFASGAGISRSAAGLKYVAQQLTKTRASLSEQQPSRPTSSEDSPVTGGSTTVYQEEIKQQGSAYNAGESFTAGLNTYLDQLVEDPTAITWEQFNNLRTDYNNAINDPDVELDPKEVDMYKALVKSYTESVSNEVTTILDNSDGGTEFTHAEINTFVQAEQLDAIKKDDIARLPKTLTEVVRHSSDIGNLIDEAENAEIPALTEEILGKSTKHVDKVHREKYQDAKNDDNLPGLRWYWREFTELLADPDSDTQDKRFLTIAKGMTRFINGQEAKLEKQNNALKQPPGTVTDGVKHIVGVKGSTGTEGFRDTLAIEVSNMKQVYTKMGQLYQAALSSENAGVQAIADTPVDLKSELVKPVLEIAEDTEPTTAETAEETEKASEPTTDEANERTKAIDEIEAIDTDLSKPAEDRTESRPELEPELDTSEQEPETEETDLDTLEEEVSKLEALVTEDETEEAETESAVTEAVETTPVEQEPEADATPEEESTDEVTAIAAIENKLKSLPAAIRKVIKVIYQKIPTVPDDAVLSLKSNLAEAGITDPNALRWAFKNKDLPALKDIKSAEDLNTLVGESYLNRTNPDNYDGIDGEVLNKSFKSWVSMLANSNGDIFFIEMMMDVPLKRVERDSVSIIDPNVEALGEVLDFYNSNQGFQGIAKMYGKVLAKYITESSDSVQAKSGKGYWVHIPRVPKPKKQNRVRTLHANDMDLIVEASAKFLGKDFVSKDGDKYRVVVGGRGTGLLTMGDLEPKVSFAIGVIQQGRQENYIRRNASQNVDVALIKGMLTSSLFNKWIIPIQKEDTERDAARKIAERKLCSLSPSTWCTASYAAKQYVEQFDNHLLVIDGKAVVGLEVKVDEDPVLDTEFRVVGATGMASAQGIFPSHMEDTLAYMDEQGLNYDKPGGTIKHAIKALEKGQTDEDFEIDTDDDFYGDEDWDHEGVFEEPTEEEIAQQALELQIRDYRNWRQAARSNWQRLVDTMQSDVYRELRSDKLSSVTAEEVLIRNNITNDDQNYLGGANIMHIAQLSPSELEAIHDQVEEEIRRAAGLNLALFEGPFPDVDIFGPDAMLLGNFLQEWDVNINYSELIHEAVIEKIHSTFFSEHDAIDVDAFASGGQGLNTEGYVLRGLAALLDLFPDAANIAKFEQLASEFLTPLTVSSMKDGKLTLTRYGVYALLTVHNIPGQDFVNPLLQPLTLERFLTPVDLLSPGPDPFSDQPLEIHEFITPKPLTTGIFKEIFEEQLEEALPFSMSYAERYVDFIHAEIFLLRRDVAVNPIAAPNQIAHPRVQGGNVQLGEAGDNNNDPPFSKQATGGIEGWAHGETATLNAAHLDPDSAVEVALHEVAHLGMIRVANESGGFSELHKILTNAKPELMKALPRLLARTGHANLEEFVADYGFDLDTEQGEAKLLIELAARWAETFATKPQESWWVDLLEKITAWVKKFVGQELDSAGVDAMVSGFLKFGADLSTEVAPDSVSDLPEVTRERLRIVARLIRRVTDNPEFPLGEVSVTHPGDNAILQGLLLQDLEPVAALRQLESIIEVDPEKRSTAVDSVLAPELIEVFVGRAKALNDGKRTKSAPLSERFVNYLSGTPAMLNRIIGNWIGREDNAEQKFRDAGLPGKLSDIFERTSEVNSLLSAVPDVMTLLKDPEAKNELYDTLELSADEIRAMDSFIIFYDLFNTQLEETLLPRINIQSKFAPTHLKQTMVEFFKDEETGLIDQNLVASMALEAMTWVTTIGPATVSNSQSTINRMLGLNENEYITDEQVSDMVRTIGTQRTRVANGLGQGAFRNSGLRFIPSAEVDPLLKDLLIASIGSITVSVLEEMGRVELIHVKNSEWSRISNRPIDEVESPNAWIGFIRNQSRPIENSEYDQEDRNRSLRLAVEPGHAVFSRLFKPSVQVRQPSFVMPTRRETRVRGTMSVLPKKYGLRILSMAQEPMVPVTSVIAIQRLFNHKDWLSMAEKYVKEEDFDTVHDTELDGTIARNRVLSDEFRAALDWEERYGQKQFYINHIAISNGRVQQDSNVINTMNSKQHRFQFRMKNWGFDVPKISGPMTEEQTVQYEQFLVAIALGLGMDVEGAYRSHIVAEVETVLESDDFNAALDLLDVEREDRFIGSERAVLEEFLGKDAKYGGVGSHTLAVMLAYKEYRDSTENKVFITIPMERDGKTYGYAGTLMQYPPAELTVAYWESLEAAGIYRTSANTESYAEHVANGGVDNYQSVSNGVENSFTKMRNGAERIDDPEITGRLVHNYLLDNMDIILDAGMLPNIDDLLTPEGRNDAKNWLTVANYGGGIPRIVEAFTNNRLQKVYQEMATLWKKDNGLELITSVVKRANQVAQLAVDARNAGGIFTQNIQEVTQEAIAARVAADFGNDLGAYARAWRLKDANAALFQEAVAGTYGIAIATALREQLDSTQLAKESVNHGIKLMNLIFVEDFKRRVSILENKRGGRLLNSDDRQTLLEEMHKEGMVPAVATPFSDPNNLEENLEVTNYSTEYLGTEETVGVARFKGKIKLIDREYHNFSRQNKNPSGQNTLGTRVIAQLPNDDSGAKGAVILMQATEGPNNSSAWGNPKTPSTNLHDAKLSSWNQSDEAAEANNESFLGIHGSYSIPDQVLKSVSRMVNFLDKDQHGLDKAAKRRVHIAFGEHLKNFDVIEARNSDPKVDTANWLSTFRGVVNDVQTGREELIPSLGAINVFAGDGTQHIVKDSQQASQQHSDPTVTLRQHLIDSREGLTGTNVPRRTAAIDTMVLNLEKGNINEAIRDFVERSHPSGEELLDVLQAAYRRLGETTESRHMSTLYQALSPYLVNVRTHSPEKGQSVRVKKGSTAEFNTGMNMVLYSRTVKSDNVTRDTLHELIHAATIPRLTELREQNEPEFDRLYDESKRFALDLGKTTKNPGELLIAQEILRELAVDNGVLGVSEYLAHVLGASSTIDKFTLHFPSEEMPGTFWVDLFSALQDPVTGRNILRSSNDRTSDELFADVYKDLLESQKVVSIFEELTAMNMGPTNVEHQSMLEDLIQSVVIPGLKSIDPIYQQLVTNPESHINIGEIRIEEIGSEATSVVRLEAAGNRLSSNVEMSLQETAVHEYLHAIFELGLTNNPAFEAEARRLYDLAQDEVDAGRLTFEQFMPVDIAGDPDTARARAEERFDYIFHNGETHLEEFLAIGLSNFAFNKILQDIDNRAPVVLSVGSSFRGHGIIGGAIDLLRRLVQWMAGNSIETTGGSLADGLQAFAQNAIYYNQKNLERIKQIKTGRYHPNIVARTNNKIIEAFGDKIITPLTATLLKREMKKISTKDKDLRTVIDVAKSATLTALLIRDSELRKEYNKFYRSMGGHKDNWIFEVLKDIMPADPQDLGTEQVAGIIDLLRESMATVDQTKQRLGTSTERYIKNAFDPKNTRLKAQMEALTIVLLNTDASSLMTGDSGITADELQEIIKDPAKRAIHLSDLQKELNIELDVQDARALEFIFDSDTGSLANFLVTNQPTVLNGVTNAHQLAQQAMLRHSDRIELSDVAKIENLLSRIATVKALQLTNSTQKNTVDLALQLIDHEQARTDEAGLNDNGFTRILSHIENFKILSVENLFGGNPLLTQKGYVDQNYDPEISIEIVKDTPAEHKRMTEVRGYKRVTPLPKDLVSDPDSPSTALYVGMEGLGTQSKATAAYTAQKHFGSNSFAVADHDSQSALRLFGRAQEVGYRAAHNRLLGHKEAPGVKMLPIYNEQLGISDYRYPMSEKNKLQVLKKEQPIERVLGRMFASISAKLNSTQINAKLVDLIWREWTALGTGKNKSPDHKFVEIGPDVFKLDPLGNLVKDADDKPIINKEARDMYNILPEPMRKDLQDRFGGKSFWLRDTIVNTALGFRKQSISNIEIGPIGNRKKLFGKHAPVVRQAERIWQEIVQLERIKIAVLTPAVVIGNSVSNTMMLLAQGVSPGYIRKKGAEAIAAMRQYQKDVREADLLELEIGGAKVLNKNTRAMVSKLARLKVRIRHNPVAAMIEAGLFTSITEDLGLDDDNIRGKLLTKTKERLEGRSKAGDIAIKSVQELYMLPGSKGYQAGVAATQYGDFVARYVLFKHQTEVKHIDRTTALNHALFSFIYYDMPQNKSLQYLNDSGLIMFTKFFLRIQSVVARLYTQNPVSAFGVLGVQQLLLPSPFNENIAHYGFGSGLMHKFHLNPVGPAWDTLHLGSPAFAEVVFNPFGL